MNKLVSEWILPLETKAGFGHSWLRGKINFSTTVVFYVFFCYPMFPALITFHHWVIWAIWEINESWLFPNIEGISKWGLQNCHIYAGLTHCLQFMPFERTTISKCTTDSAFCFCIQPYVEGWGRRSKWLCTDTVLNACTGGNCSETHSASISSLDKLCPEQLSGSREESMPRELWGNALAAS